MTCSITGAISLRHESPSLALLLYFIAPKARNYFADVVLLWLECRRGLYASEAMPSAIRLAWWRDALRTSDGDSNNDSDKVPLVARLYAHQHAGVLALPKIADAIAAMIERRLAGESPQAIIQDWHACLAEYVVLSQFYPRQNDNDDKQATSALAVLDKAMLGEATPLANKRESRPKNLVQIRLMYWLASNPARLNYPQQVPWLPLHMAFGLALRWI